MHNEGNRFPNPFTVKNQRRLAWTSLAFFTVTLVYIVLFEANSILVFIGLSAAYFTLLAPSFLSKKGSEEVSQIAQDSAIDLLSKSPLPVFTYHVQNDEIRIRYANPAIKHVYYDDAVSLINQPITKLAMIEDEEEMLTACSMALEDPQTDIGHSFFIRGKDQNHDMVKLMCFTSKIDWLGKNIGICFVFDISKMESKYAEMNAHMQEGYMGTLVAGIVHDFRNVLTSIIGTAEALQFNMDNQEAIKQLDIIIDAGERGSDTVTHLLKLSSGSQSEEDIPYVDVKPVLKSIISLLRLQLPANIKLLHKFEPNLPAIKLNTTQLEQILMNLVNNASQAIQDKGVVSIHVGEEMDERYKISGRRTLKLSVSDNGCGIAEEDLPHVTQNFWSLRKNKGGTGLGLAMVKRIVNNNQGMLHITSKLNVGTQINLYFPAQKAEQALQSTAIEHDTKSKTPLATAQELENDKVKPCTILLVDDQADVLHVHKLLLEAMGHTILTANSGEEALEVYTREHERIQMLVTDFKMPDIDGIDLAEALYIQAKGLALLMVTAYGETEKLQRAQAIDMAIILKPSSFKKFSDAIIEIQRKQPDIFS